mmetsp:Transcript_7310/g.22299  ORF Transcript_7310/g.22299 Transcript_7310/m.22299 type:complete len:283 (+) Transcript_7310:2252-3100(+)
MVRKRSVRVVHCEGAGRANCEHCDVPRIRDVGGDCGTIPPIPAIGLHPVLCAETCGLPTIARVVHVHALNVALSVAVALKQVHDVGLHRLGAVHETLRSDVQAAYGVPSLQGLAVGAPLVRLVPAVALHPLNDSVSHSHGKGDRVLVVGGVPCLYLADALCVLPDHRGAVAERLCVVLFHLDLLEVELRVVDLDGVDAAVRHAVPAAHLRPDLDGLFLLLVVFVVVVVIIIIIVVVPISLLVPLATFFPFLALFVKLLLTVRHCGCRPWTRDCSQGWEDESP